MHGPVLSSAPGGAQWGRPTSPCTCIVPGASSLWSVSEGVSTQCKASPPWPPGAPGETIGQDRQVLRSLILRLSHPLAPQSRPGHEHQASAQGNVAGAWQVQDGRHCESSRALAPGSATTPNVPCRPTGFQNTQCLQARLPQEGQPRGPACAPCSACTPTAWGPHPPLPLSSPWVPCLPASKTTILGLCQAPGSLASHLPLIALCRHSLHHLPGDKWLASGTRFLTNRPQAPKALPNGGELHPQDEGPSAEDRRAEALGAWMALQGSDAISLPHACPRTHAVVPSPSDTCPPD